jgi:hypothetical protein
MRGPQISRSDVQGRRQEFPVPDPKRRGIKRHQAPLVEVCAEGMRISVDGFELQLCPKLRKGQADACPLRISNSWAVSLYFGHRGKRSK